MDASPSRERFWRASLPGARVAALGSSLEFAAEGVCAIAGLPFAGIGVVHGDHVVITAVAGSRGWRDGVVAEELVERLLGMELPVDMVEHDVLARGVPRGPLVYVPAEGVPPQLHLSGQRRDPGRDPGPEPAPGPEAPTAAEAAARWRSGDRLLAPIRDDQGRLRGMLALAGPREWLLPPADRISGLEWLIARVTQLVLTLVTQQESDERLALARTARDIIVRAVDGESPETVLAGVAQDLMAAFDAETLRATSYDGDQVHTLLALGRELGYPDGWLPEIGRAAAERLWRDQQVMVVDRHEVLNPAETPLDRRQFLDFIEANGYGSLQLTPYGAGETCLGCLAVYRRRGARRWTEAECAIAQEIGRDVGRLVVLHRSLQTERAAAEELRALDAYRANLIATVAHEVRTPVTAIRLNHDLAVQDASPELEPALSGIAAATVRLERLADDLLLHSAATRDRAVPRTVVDLSEVVRHAASEAAHAAGALEDRIMLDLDDAHVIGDPDQLGIVVVNLIGNALKYSASDSPIVVALSVRGDEVVVSVGDHGIGISEDDQLHLFDEFFRSFDPAARARHGTGLGLSIVKRLAEQHSGHITVESKLDQGSTFRVHLPTTTPPQRRPSASGPKQ